jgi:hypothetical protein
VLDKALAGVVFFEHFDVRSVGQSSCLHSQVESPL